MLQRAPAVILSAHIRVSVVAFCYGRRSIISLASRRPVTKQSTAGLSSARLIFVESQVHIQTIFDKFIPYKVPDQVTS